ncbi:MAG TPA: LacI family DNA-binding transcriptional regulator [Rhodoglobus sp.]|nr:LacI family DNA-binding transcriptional regulator [Rhodoglobus sp.]
MGTVSIRDVAVRAGVSVGTVSNVLNGSVRVSPESSVRVRAAIAELGYVRNDAARQLRAGRSSTVGLVVLDVGNPFFTDLARGVEDRADEAGLTVMLGNSDERADREARYLDSLEEQRAHGVLLSPIGEVEHRLHRLRDRGIPVVLVDRTSEDPAFSSVAVDDVAGGRIAVEHLLASGRERVAFVGGPLGIRQVSDRLAGARSTGADIEVIETEALTVLAGRAAGTRLRERTDRPDAVFAANDLVALGVMQALVMQGGLRVPDEIALVGYDDIAFAASAVVPLTSVRQPSALLGRTALELLIAEAADPEVPRQQLVFQPELVVRESTGATAAPAAPRG